MVFRVLRAFLILFPLLFHFACQESTEPLNLPEVVDFNLHVRPILSNNCFVCHGPDPSSRKSDLRLDLEETAKGKGESGLRAIVEGSAKRSQLYQRLISHDPEEVMPPPTSNRTLSRYDQELIGKWIDQGARWKKHWAFIPPVATNVDHASTTIDQLISNKVLKNGLVSAPPAKNETLTRRLAFVLTGLPPRKVDLELDLTDSTVYNNYVKELLSRPAYGERWARHWMDLARYAEGRGHEFDYPVMGATHYRDYLIRAFNDDVPYDLFVKEQLAGDLLESPRIDPMSGTNASALGTIFLNLGEAKHSPVDSKAEEKIRIDNVIDVTSMTFLGLTVACARCHDHKFDAIPTTDYYAWYGIFESSRSNMIPVNQDVALQHTIDSLDVLREEIKHYIASLDEGQIKGRASLIHSKAKSADSLVFSILGDFRGPDFGTWKSDGLAFGQTTTLHDLKIPQKGEAIINQTGKASSRKNGTGISGALRSPTFILEQDYLLFRASGKASSIRIILDNLQLIQDPIHGALSITVDDGESKDYISDVSMWKGSKVYIEILPGQYTRHANRNHYYRLDQDAWIDAEYVLAMDSLITTSSQAILGGSPIDAENVQASIPQEAIAHFHALDHQIASRTPDSIFAAGTVDGSYIESPVFIRGDHFDLSQETVPHRFLTALPDVGPDFPSDGSGRLQLAEAIVDPQNPITARVMVNRIWHHLFGTGIVSTVDNFGLQGTLPSNLELLDHLAIKFIEMNWSIKRMIQYICESSAFKQSTVSSTENDEKDPQNRHLHHYPIRRMEAETIRDAILAASGRLDQKMYGPSVPLHLTDFLQGRGRPSVSGPLDGAGRRSIYQAMWRNFLPPFMLTFDMPIPFSAIGRRSETNVPAQSLTLLNDPFIKEQTHVWASRLIANYPTAEERITEAYLDAFSRKPTADELGASMSFLKEQALLYKNEETSDNQLIIWADYCHSLINMKEFIYLI